MTENPTPASDSPVDKAKAVAEETLVKAKELADGALAQAGPAVDKAKTVAEEAVGKAKEVADGLLDKVKGLKP